MDPALPAVASSRSHETLDEVKFRKIFAETSIKLDARGEKLEERALKWFNKLMSSEKKLKSTHIKFLINELIVRCLTHTHDTYSMHLNRLKGIKIINNIVTNCPRGKIEPENATHIIWAMLSCLHHFFVRLRAEKGVLELYKRRQARTAVKTYDRLLLFLTPEHYETIFTATMTFLEEANLWSMEFFCSSVLKRILQRASEEERCRSIVEIISLVEDTTMTSVSEARELLLVFTTLGQSVDWAWMDGSILTSIMDVYISSMVPEENHGLYESLEKSLASLLQAMAFHLNPDHMEYLLEIMFTAILADRVSGENLLHFGAMLEFIHKLYTQRSTKHALNDNTLPAIIEIIKSPVLLRSQLGLRLMHVSIDRCNNKGYFENPKIFLRNTSYDIKINRFREEDKRIFQGYRQLLANTAIEVFMTNGVNDVYITSFYICIALYAVEVPCAYMAAAVLSLALILQQYALVDKSMSVNHAHRIHACVVSLVSLVCYIHKAEVLYDYVDSIVEKRAELAPHLNPPLKIKYSYAQHHILWNDPQLFFQDWKVRYGLWKCFRTRRKNVSVRKKEFTYQRLNIA